MWHIRTAVIVVAGILLLTPGMRADGLQLKNGNFVQGKYLGGTERAVQFELNGKVHLYDIGEILSISFAPASPDGAVPSNNLDPKPSANMELNFAEKNNHGLRNTLWDQTKVPKVAAQQVAWRNDEGSGKPIPLAPTCAVPAANSRAGKRVSEIRAPAPATGILRQRFSLLSD
jgi:hypothetical protein